jgi:hypothetical protein
MRDIYYQTVIINGSTELDLLSSLFKDFKNFIKNKFVNIYTVNEDTENSADLISYKNYGIHDYWWLICELNNITDPLTELVRGKQLAIPNISDINLYIQSKQSNNFTAIREISL